MKTVAEKLQIVRAKINWDQLFKTASSIRSQPCTSDGNEFLGGCNVVYCIAFDDGTRWALRIPYNDPVEPTVTTMRYVHSTVPDIPIAAVHAWSDSEDGDGVGTPYILLDWIEGRTLQWNASFPPPAARGKVLAKLAQYSADLLVRTSTHSSTIQSALAWMLRSIDARLIRIFTGDLPAESFDPIDCLVYRAMAEEKYHIPSLDALPFPLMHTDLSKYNILVDDDFNINGILDWDDWAWRLPLQCAVMCPVMIAAGNAPPHDAVFRKDRLAFIDYFASVIGSSGFPDDIAVHLPSIMADEERQIFHWSISSKGVYAHWVTKYCVRSTHWVKAATRALDNFVVAHPDMASKPEVLSARVCLLGMQEKGFGRQE